MFIAKMLLSAGLRKIKALMQVSRIAATGTSGCERTKGPHKSLLNHWLSYYRISIRIRGLSVHLFGLCGWLSGLFGSPCTQGKVEERETVEHVLWQCSDPKVVGARRRCTAPSKWATASVRWGVFSLGQREHMQLASLHSNVHSGGLLCQSA